MNISVKRIKSKLQGHINVSEKVFSDTEDFSQKKSSRLRAMKKKLGDSRLAMEKLDAFAKEEEVDESAMTKNVEKCQAALMLLEECICAIEIFEEDFAKGKLWHYK